MASTYELIASQTLGSSAAYIEFTSIPATFDDLVLVASVRSVRTGNAIDQFRGYVNGDQSAASWRFLRGDGSTASSGTGSGYFFLGNAPAASSTGDTFGSFKLHIPNYAGSTYKSISSTFAHETNATAAYLNVVASLWSNTAAVTSLRIFTFNANLAASSSAYLYGISHS